MKYETLTTVWKDFTRLITKETNTLMIAYFNRNVINTARTHFNELNNLITP